MPETLTRRDIDVQARELYDADKLGGYAVTSLFGESKMSEEDDLAVEAAKALGAIVPEAYRDLLQPAARELGQSLLLVAKAVNVVLSPLSATVWGFGQIRDWLLTTLTRKLAKVPVEHIQTPSIQLAGQILINLQFVMDQELLRDMYANLLASAMNSDSANRAHPAYVSILQQLSPDEARLLAFIASRPRKEIHWSDHYEEGAARSISLEEKWVEVCGHAAIVDLTNSNAYLDNLIRLRILAVDQFSTTRLATHSYYSGELREGLVRELYLTDFGARLIETCILEETLGVIVNGNSTGSPHNTAPAADA